MKIIIVTGSVGTGKTTLAKKLSKKLNYQYINVNKIIQKNNLPSGYDKKRKCKIIDIKKLNKFLINLIKESKKDLIIDSHLSHYLPKKYVNLCIVTKCNIKEINKRLKKRKYNKEKIKENIECEIFDICLNEAKKAKHKIIVINTTKGINIAKISKRMI
jgi:adenylate kinase